MDKLLIIFIIFLNLSCVTLPGQKEYSALVKSLTMDSLDFSFIELKHYLHEYPDTPHAKKISFALAEYYFQIRDFRDAVTELTAYINDYGDDKSAIFAYFMLYKIISEQYQNENTLGKMREKFFSKSLFLMFAEAKTQSYKSILNNTYKVNEHIDNIEVYKNNDLFLKIIP